MIAALEFGVKAIAVDHITEGPNPDPARRTAWCGDHADSPSVIAVDPGQAQILVGVGTIGRDGHEAIPRETGWQRLEWIRMRDQHEAEGLDLLRILLAGIQAEEWPLDGG